VFLFVIAEKENAKLRKISNIKSSRFQVQGSKFKVPSSRFQVPSSRFQVPSFWILSSGVKQSMPE
jgi:hypothetical protein